MSPSESADSVEEVKMRWSRLSIRDSEDESESDEESGEEREEEDEESRVVGSDGSKGVSAETGVVRRSAISNSRSPWILYCSARLRRGGAEGVMGMADTKAKRARLSIRMKERMVDIPQIWIFRVVRDVAEA